VAWLVALRRFQLRQRPRLQVPEVLSACRWPAAKMGQSHGLWSEDFSASTHRPLHRAHWLSHTTAADSKAATQESRTEGTISPMTEPQESNCFISAASADSISQPNSQRARGPRANVHIRRWEPLDAILEVGQLFVF
jgi:hypothetical protein